MNTVYHKPQTRSAFFALIAVPAPFCEVLCGPSTHGDVIGNGSLEEIGPLDEIARDCSMPYDSLSRL